MAVEIERLTRDLTKLKPEEAVHTHGSFIVVKILKTVLSVLAGFNGSAQ
jgi:hypothetical protein